MGLAAGEEVLVRDPRQMLKDIEAASACAKKKLRHKFVRHGPAFTIFFTPPERYQELVCKKCGHTTWVRELKSVKGKGAAER